MDNKGVCMKKILVTGAGGFIGGHLVTRLKEEGFWVRGVDIKEHEYKKSGADEFMLKDLRIMENCLVACANIDECYTLAADMGGAQFVFTGENDADIMHNSAKINLNMVESCRVQGVKKIFYSSSACFVAGTKVFTDKGFIPIEEVDGSCKVIAEDGEWHKVLKRTETPYSGPLCRIKALSANEIVCTPDHRFLMDGFEWVKAEDTEKVSIYEVVPDLGVNDEPILLESDWGVEAYKELQSFGEPLYLLAEKYKMSLSTPYKWARRKEYPLRIDPVTYDKIEKNYDLGRLVGLILSEGWYETHKEFDTERVVCCFGKHEKELIEDYKDLLQKVLGIPENRIVQYETRTGIKIHVTSKRFVSIMRKLCVFDHGSKKKGMTFFGMTGSEDYRKGILEGSNEGDGCSQVVSHGNFYRHLWSSTSSDLSLQYSIILKSIGKVNSIQVRPGGKWDIEGRSGIASESFHVYTKLNPTVIQSVGRFEVEDEIVYNLEVDEKHSYIVEGIVVHNCIYPDYNQTDPDNPKLSEDSAYPASPDSDYGWEKLFSEHLYFAYHRNYGLDVRVARFHNIFGTLGTWNGGKEKAPAAVARKVAETPDGGTIEIWGPGIQTRSFLYIEECLEGVRRFMDSDFMGPVNIGSEEMISINNLAKMAMDISGKNLTIKNVEGPIGVMGRNSDNRLLRKELGWVPEKPLRYGMEKLYDWISCQLPNVEE